MCGTCGCSDTSHDGSAPADDPHRDLLHAAHDHSHSPGHAHEPSSGPSASDNTRRIQLEVDLLAKNNRLADENRAWLQARDIAAFNLMGAPGAGKTALLEALLARLGQETPVAVLEGDQATDRDAARIRQSGAPVAQINTGAGCHLDAHMVRHGLEHLDPQDSSILFIENVGNLVCPAMFALGERAKIVVMSVTEGDDKPEKYPHMFRGADVLVINKVDLLEHVDFDVDRAVDSARRLAPRVQPFVVSARRGDGLDRLCAWLRGQAAAVRAEASLSAE